MSFVPTPLDLELINRAYALIGQDPITSVDVETPGAMAAVLLYRQELDHCLGFYPWGFATRAFSLAQLADDPGDGWTYAYLLPPERIGPPIAVSDTKDFRQQFTDYALAEDHVHADVTALWARCLFRADPATWPGVFTKAFVTSLAAEFAMSVTSDAKTRAALKNDAWGPEQMMGRGGLMGLAIQRDTQTKPSPIIMADGGPLLQARRGSITDWPG